MINGLNGGYKALLRYFKLALIYKKKMVTLFGLAVTMEMKDQDVSHRGMVTSGRERPCFPIPATITQQRDKGNGLW